MNNSKIDRIECVPLIGTRPREAGCNSRSAGTRAACQASHCTDYHQRRRDRFRFSRVCLRRDAAGLVGAPLSEAFDLENGVSERFRGLEYPLWDLAGKLVEKPVYEMLGRGTRCRWCFPCPLL